METARTGPTHAAQRDTDVETPPRPPHNARAAGEQAARTPGQRAGLTREAVLATAHELLTERGLDGLSMRELARRLGVAPNAIYSHVAGKTALVDDLLDEVLAAVETPDAETNDPTSGLTRIMTSTYRVLLDHPDLVPLYLARQGARGPNAQALGEVMFAQLAQAGITGSAAHEARRVLIVYTIGFAALATPTASDASDDRPLSSAELFGNFTAGLAWLLNGIMSDA
ncbi:TetR/AcrR family transcriptional regulator [Phytoactinopolyspora halotolerans]|uniref:TetR family transcriptional regulator n=1 Tax=Phytoactinopolyspora halotolerans TaxID=1981512 RepID=A0A6L9S3N8_9ACTN|nr:TetR/AcrR family transcriptional regulator [Phytoactinopolyspora halotolerans]NED99047.1 TetR family transcriptional regulator [Phytoactinopolyspora halotolerans]